MIWKKDDLIKIEKYNIMEEENKYYVIELDKDYLLECLTCKAPNDFSKNDICFFKEEKDAEWKNCSQENFELNGDTLEINLYEKYNIQFLKINKIISDIQIFIRKYRGLIVSDRRDGFGCRMASMINAMYLSKKTGFKFGYSWIRVNSSSNDSGVILAMTDEEEIFDKKFIDEHSYTAKKLMSRGTYFIENSLENIKNKPYENSWGYFCTTYRSLAYFKDIDKDEYRRECKFLWEHLPFNQRYLKLIDDAKEYIAKLGTDWVAIHVRNGDNVYFESLRQLLLLDVSVNRIIPYQLILKMIDDLTSEGKKIVLFSPDIELTFSLQSFYREKNEHIYIADDFVLEEMSQMERTLYDFALMSKASEIYMPKDSLYSIFAYRIGEAKKAISIDKMYSSNELYDIIQTYNKYSINVHRLQKAASCAYQYRLACDLRKTNKEKIDILNEGLFLDPNNYAFLIEKMDIMLVSQNFKGVDDILKELFAENNKPFFDVLLRKTHLLQYYYGRVIQRFKNSNVSTFLYCNYVVARIYENLGDWNRSLEMVMDVIFIKNSSHNLYFEYLIELLKKYKKIHVSHDEIDFFKSANLQLQNKLQQKDQIIQTKNQELETKTQELTQTKNQLDSTKIQLNSTQKELDSTKQQLDSKVKELDSKTKEFSSLPIKKQTLEIKNLEQDLINKQLHTKQLEKELGYESNVLKELELKNQELIQTKNQLDFTKKQLDSKTKELESKNKILESNPNPSHLIQNTPHFKGKLAYLNTLTTAKSRIHNHLSYKLGQAMIENSKSLLGYIRMPYVLSYIKDKHKQEQQQYQEAIKKNPNLKLPNLESYPDYKESLKEKECLAYKLGEAFIKASKTWYKGGYVKLWFEVRELKKEFEK